MKNIAKLVLNNLPKLKISLESMTKQAVYVGVPGDTTARKEAGINNASIAYISENGSPANNIPARPSMRLGLKAVQGRVVKTLGAAARSSLRDQPDAIEQGLHKAGLITQSSIKAKINEGIPPPLAVGTLAARRRRGRTGTKPLIDTAQFRNSITYVIRRKQG